jgi:hypothetical protein
MIWWVGATVLGLLFSCENLLLFLSSGFLIGFFQWLWLRDRIPKAALWIPLTGAGWLSGITLVLIADHFISSFLSGSLGYTGCVMLAFLFGIGVTGWQALCFRKHDRYRFVFFSSFLGYSLCFYSMYMLLDLVAPELPMGFVGPNGEIEQNGFSGWHYFAVVVPGIILGSISAFGIQTLFQNRPTHESAQPPGSKHWILPLWRRLPQLAALALICWWVVVLFTSLPDSNPPGREPLFVSREPTAELINTEKGEKWIKESYRFYNEAGKPSMARNR